MSGVRTRIKHRRRNVAGSKHHALYRAVEELAVGSCHVIADLDRRDASRAQASLNFFLGHSRIMLGRQVRTHYWPNRLFILRIN